MATVAYFEHRKTGKRYKLLEFDSEAQTVRLQGPNRPFVEPYDKERFKKMGYRLIRVEESG